MNNYQPSAFPSRLLILVAGLTPQIVTETLYALAKQKDPFIPTQIHLITTQAGAERATRLLLNNPPAYFAKLCKELNIENINFTSRNIHLLRNSKGEPLEDIRTPEENAAVADQIMQLMRGWCACPETALHVSLAGGRKTMSYYLGTALSFFGRPQDRLSHVLVEEAFENLRDFFYPTKENQLIYNANNQPLNTAEAKISLAPIPFVRLSNEKPALIQTGTKSFSSLVEAAQQALGKLHLTLNPVLGKLSVQGETANLADTDLTFMLWFISKGYDANNPWQPPSEGDYCQVAAQEFLAIYVQVQALHGGNDDRPNISLRKGMDLDWFRNRVKHLKLTLSKQLGLSLAEKARIALIKRSPARYGLAVENDQITVEDFDL